MQGASPLASPGLGGARHWWTMPVAKERGDRGRGTSAFEMVLSPGAGRTSAAGVLAFFAACPPCLRFTFLPLSPQPPSRREGGDQSYFMQGASPLASPGLNPRGTGKGGEPRARRGACPLRGGERGQSRCPPGCLPSLPPAHPAFALLSCPHPPVPLPGGKGEILGYFMQGASPLASPGLNLYGAGSTFGKQFLWVMSKTFPFNNTIEKSSGGLGDSFKSPPAFSLFFRLYQRPFPSII